ncbi:sodium/calcium exchanger 1 [Necator americanus]|uniref:Sodium/calcium exchanger 1 n=1 Tax=Necator americanus TaxID=51031 RepID=W2T7N1_NECAM|nr:sodium/calcium exchanger 1 [Necator americanus]ETN77634.1 sodium/calcium exchanger 1 [Necator americanus]
MDFHEALVMSNYTCHDGLILPALAVSPRNAVLYLIGLLYSFLGISIAADVFMCSIERITSTTRKVRKKQDKGILIAGNLSEEEEYEEVKVWNPTVANLTLMALGSSAPEILLSIIEIVGNGFRSGELGPGTIVGSAAFNLFCISAICVLAVASPNVKRIQMFKVFVVTAFFGTFAYIWLLVILSFISPDVVEVWEAAVTLAFFVVLVVISYCVDVKIWKSDKADLENELEMADQKKPAENLDVNLKRYASKLSIQPDGARITGELPRPSLDMIRSLSRDVGRTYPALSVEDQAKILAYRLNKNTPHDRLYHRIRAARLLCSGLKKTDVEREVEDKLVKYAGVTTTDGRRKPRVEFSARVYAVEPTDKKVTLTIVRHGPCPNDITLNYCTQSGVAKKHLHFLPKSETIKMAANERTREVTVDLVDNADWRSNHVFYVNLKIQDQPEDDKTKLGTCDVARVRYPDDTASLMGEPAIEFVHSNYVAKENCRLARVFVTRRGKKHRGDTVVHYETTDVTAQAGHDYTSVKDGRLKFVGQEYEKYIDIEIIDDKQDEKDETFNVELTSVEDDEVTLGGKRRTVVTIVSDDNALMNIVNVHKLTGHYMSKLSLYKSSWMDQIREAVSVNAGDIASATLCDCILHGIAFPWKFMFSFVPPPTFFGGWLCFFVGLALIGLLTAVVGDLASIFGCMVGLKDAVTAITLVALGTSLPDTFASKIAAENDDTADNAVGNVTGSNSVNVFLGLGLPWLIASIYWASKGETFSVPAADLGFSVTVFMCCSVVFLAVLLLRRTSAVFGQAELGGPFGPKFASGVFFVLLWLVYVGMSVWYTYRK